MFMVFFGIYGSTTTITATGSIFSSGSISAYTSQSVHASVEETAVSPSLALSCLSCPGVLRSWPYIKGAPLDKKLVVVDETVAVTTTVLASQLHSTQARIDKKFKL